MIIINANEKKCIDLGKRGESCARKVVFDITGWAELYGQGTVHVVAQRAFDLNPYPVEVTQDNNQVSWIVTPVDNDHPGYGQCELVYVTEGSVAKSVSYQTHTDVSLSDPVSPPDKPNLYTTLLKSIGNIEELKTVDKSCLVNAINEVFDRSGVTLDDEMVSKALYDYLKENPITAESIGAVSIEKLSEAVEEALAQAKASGEFDGSDGYTPIKGVDYFTPSEVQDIAEQASLMVEVPSPNPSLQALTFTGAVEATYDGTKAVTVDIPDGGGDDYTLPIATPETLGGVMPVAKTDEMTVPVGVDNLGRLWAERGFETLIDFTTEETVAEFQVPIGTDEIVAKIQKATDIYLLISIPRDAEGDTTTESVGNITLSLYTTWKQSLFSDVQIITSPSHTWSWGGKMLCHFTNVPLCDSRGIAQAPTLQECFYCRDSIPNSSKSAHTGQGVNVWYSYFSANSYFIVTGTQNMYKGTRFILGVAK